MGCNEIKSSPRLKESVHFSYADEWIALEKAHRRKARNHAPLRG